MRSPSREQENLQSTSSSSALAPAERVWSFHNSLYPKYLSARVPMLISLKETPHLSESASLSIPDAISHGDASPISPIVHPPSAFTSASALAASVLAASSLSAMVPAASAVAASALVAATPALHSHLCGAGDSAQSRVGRRFSVASGECKGICICLCCTPLL